MPDNLSYEVLHDPAELSACRGWSEEVYRDLLALKAGELSESAFREKYQCRRAVLVLDIAGFTASAMHFGEVPSLLRVFDVQSICIPVLKSFEAELVRCFADDVVGVFREPGAALDAAFEIHERIGHFVSDTSVNEVPALCCIGIGYGDIFRIGPNLAQGDEMNRASKLGEDFARGGETLVTERTFKALRERPDITFEPQHRDDQLFSYYAASRKQ